MTTLTMRMINKGDFVVTGPDVEPMKFKSRREAKDWCIAHYPGLPIKVIGTDALKQFGKGEDRSRDEANESPRCQRSSLRRRPRARCRADRRRSARLGCVARHAAVDARRKSCEPVKWRMDQPCLGRLLINRKSESAFGGQTGKFRLSAP
jgi:hypothetical protein